MSECVLGPRKLRDASVDKFVDEVVLPFYVFVSKQGRHVSPRVCKIFGVYLYHASDVRML